jgi:hypothetical protein
VQFVPDVVERCSNIVDGHLRAIVLADADSALAAETVGPEAVELNVALSDVSMSNEEPCTKDTLGEDIEDGVSNDLTVDAGLASTVGDTPDTKI